MTPNTDQQQVTRLTLYQAVKYSKISRYKLQQAIDEGILKTIKGKGNVKCFIYENELQIFLENYGHQYAKYNFDSHAHQQGSQDEEYISRAFHEEILAEKERIINLLEFQNNILFSTINQSDKSTGSNTKKKLLKLQLK